MLKNRLSRADLAEMRRAQVRRVHGTYFSLIAKRISGGKHSKFTCAVSTKVARKAVERNRIKRLCREAVRNMLGELKQPLALVFYAKREATRASHGDVTRDIEKLISQAV